MKKTIIALAVILGTARLGQAAPLPGSHPYLRLLDPHHIQQSMGFNFDPSGVMPTIGKTDFALLTHSTADGTIMPDFCRNTFCPPENWVPLGLGFGGSFKGDAIIDLNTTINLAPQIGALILAKIDANSAPFAQAVKAAMLCTNGQGVRLGYAFQGQAVKAGTLLRFKEAFPGHGLGQIVQRASRIDAGYGWKW